MTKLYYEFTDQTHFDAKIAEQNAYLSLPRPHCLNDTECPNVQWDETSGTCSKHPTLATVIMLVDTEAVYNAHTSSPIDPYWKPNLFNGLNSYATLQDAEAAGYFPDPV